VRLCVTLRSNQNYHTMPKDRLVTPSYVLILAANFLLYFAFYLILPVLPFYLTEIFQTGNAAVGVILSCYTVASLCIRPFSGYLLDTLARKPLYLILPVHHRLCRIHPCRGAVTVHHAPGGAWTGFRNGDRSG